MAQAQLQPASGDAVSNVFQQLDIFFTSVSEHKIDLKILNFNAIFANEHAQKQINTSNGLSRHKTEIPIRI